MGATQQLLISYGGSSWTPADIANLYVFLWTVQANCTPSTIGGPVSSVAPLYGTIISASQSATPATATITIAGAGQAGPTSVSVDGSGVSITYGDSTDIPTPDVFTSVTGFPLDAATIATSLASYLSAQGLSATFIDSGSDVNVVTTTVGTSSSIDIAGTTTYGTDPRPTLRSNGLEFNTTDGVLNFSEPALLVTGDFTIYCVGLVPTDGLIMIGSNSTGAYFGEIGGLKLAANAGTARSTSAATGTILCRATRNSGDAIVQSSGGVTAAFNSFTGNFTFDTIGAAPGTPVFNQDTANRNILTVIIQRYIALNSDEDVLIRNWITTNTGASL